MISKKLVLKLFVTAVAAVAVATAAALALRQMRSPDEEKPDETPLPDAVLVFSFYGNKKSSEFERVEKTVRKAIDISFSNELKDGRLVWQTINYELPENSRLAGDFQVTTATIMVADARSDRPGIAKNLQSKIWKLARDEKALGEYVVGEVREMLK